MSTYYRDMRDKILQVEQQGFNPYMQSYEAQIARLQPVSGNVPEPTEGASEGLEMTPTTVQSQILAPQDTTVQSQTLAPQNTTGGGATIPEAFKAKGLDDPFKNMTSKSGDLNLPRLTTGYNQLLNNPDIGIDPGVYVDTINNLYSTAIGEKYNKKGIRVEVGPNNTLRLSKEKTARERASELEPRFEQQKDGEGNTIYLDTRGSEILGNKAYKKYDSERSFLDDVEAYEEEKKKKKKNKK